jgi:hypothetical protein
VLSVSRYEGDFALSRSANMLSAKLLGRVGVEKLGCPRNGLVVARECILFIVRIALSLGRDEGKGKINAYFGVFAERYIAR